MTAFSPRYCVALLLALLLAVGNPTPAQAEYGGSYYYGGNTSFGDYGGFAYPRSSGGGQLFDANMGGGLGIDLGCGSLNIMDYMKATFNVGDIIERGKAAMQTMLAKVVMTYLLSQPYIASAMNMLDGMLNFGFSMFEQSCDLGEIQASVKKEAMERCKQDAGGDHAKLIQCQQQADPVKSFLSNATADISKNLGLFDQDPIGAMQNSFCDPKYADRSANQNPVCLFMSFAPRFCVDSSVGGGCTGPKNRKPPITGAAIQAATRAYADLTMDKCAQVWDEIRDADPSITPEGLQAIAVKAGALAAADEAAGKAGASLHSPANRNMLAMTNLSKVMTTFAADGSDTESSEQVLEEYRNIHLAGCSETNRNDPLRMCRYIAKAAIKELSENGKSAGGIDDRVEFDESEKVDAMEFFDVPQGAEEELKKAGIDPETATKMLEETFSCQANGQSGYNENTHLTSPMMQVAIATGNKILIEGRLQNTDWRTTSASIGRSISCGSVEKIYSFWVKKVNDAKLETLSKEEMEMPSRTVKGTDGKDATFDGGKLTTETLKTRIEGATEYAATYFKQQLEANRLKCGKFLGSAQ